MSTFCLYFRAIFGTFFPKVFLEEDCNAKKDPCAVFGCNNDRLFPEKYTVKDHIYYIQTRHKDLFSRYNLILRKL